MSDRRVVRCEILDGEDPLKKHPPSASLLQLKVLYAIADGWQPQGGVASDGTNFWQAMVRYEE